MNTPNDFPVIDWTIPADPQEIAQLREDAKWPLWEKLQWLESAQIMAQSLARSQLKQAQATREETAKSEFESPSSYENDSSL